MAHHYPVHVQGFPSRAEALTATMPEPLRSGVMYATCSGSESNDLTLRVAKKSRSHGECSQVLGFGTKDLRQSTRVPYSWTYYALPVLWSVCQSAYLYVLPNVMHAATSATGGHVVVSDLRLGIFRDFSGFLLARSQRGSTAEHASCEGSIFDSKKQEPKCPHCRSQEADTWLSWTGLITAILRPRWTCHPTSSTGRGAWANQIMSLCHPAHCLSLCLSFDHRLKLSSFILDCFELPISHLSLKNRFAD